MKHIRLSKDELIEWINTWLAENERDAREIRSDTLLADTGLSSVQSVEMCFQLSELLEVDVDPTSIWEYPSIGEFAQYVVSMQSEEDETVDSEAAVASAELPTPKIDNLPRTTPSVDESTRHGQEAVAIVGMSGRFPKADNIEEFWQNLVNERDCIDLVPDERWKWRDIFGDPQKEENRTNIKWGGFINGIDEFDSLFFGISPREAELMDPQQRLLMIYAWKAIEDAGYSAQSLAGTDTAIYVGTGSSGYDRLVEKANIPIQPFSATGAVPSVGPNRVSFFLDLHGPSEPVETACSSSLVALHRASESILAGHCDMALAGGVNTIITPDFHIGFSKAGMLSQDGRCKTYSANADGYVRSEGVGMLFLKRLSEAERDGDHIYGVLRGSAENHGGQAKSLTAPNPTAQADLVKKAYHNARMPLSRVSYIETHGTGTKLGDPIEINGLKSAFREAECQAEEDQSSHLTCALATVKSNIGHLELAAGVAGVIKVLLQLKHNTLVKSLHCDDINPLVDLSNSSFYILQESQEWTAHNDEDGNRIPRVAGVSSFGFGGVNAHVVIEEYIPAAERIRHDDSHPGPAMIVVSSKTERQLNEQIANLRDSLQREHINTPLHDIAHTLQVGRDAMDYRFALMVHSVEELVEKMTHFLEGRTKESDCFLGTTETNADISRESVDDPDVFAMTNALIEKAKFKLVLALWAKGVPVDWSTVNRSKTLRRVSLPGYSFNYQRCWITPPNLSTGAQKPLHPLVHSNTSTLRHQRFTSMFTGNEPFLDDHRINHHRILPGAAYLEWVRAALEQCYDDELGANLSIRNMAWISPFVFSDATGVDCHFECKPGKNGQLEFEIYSYADSELRRVHVRGSAEIDSPSTLLTVLDVSELLLACEKVDLDAATLYRSFARRGFQYGPSHQALKHLYIGDGYAMAQLDLPEGLFSTQTQCALHPGMLDAAFQATIGLFMRGTNVESMYDIQPQVPFALEELRVFKPFSSSMWAVVRECERKRNTDLRKMNIDLCDKHGQICAHIDAYTQREITPELLESVTAGGMPNVSLTATSVPEKSDDYREILAQVSANTLSRENFKSLIMSRMNS